MPDARDLDYRSRECESLSQGHGPGPRHHACTDERCGCLCHNDYQPWPQGDAMTPEVVQSALTVAEQAADEASEGEVENVGLAYVTAERVIRLLVEKGWTLVPSVDGE